MKKKKMKTRFFDKSGIHRANGLIADVVRVASFAVSVQHCPASGELLDTESDHLYKQAGTDAFTRQPDKNLGKYYYH